MCGIGERRSEEMPKKAANIKLMKILLLALGVLIVALVVMLILLLAQGGANDDKQDAFVAESTYLNGISIAGIDISGQTYVQAAANAELQELAQQVEDGFSYSFTVNGVAYTFSAAELGVTSNLDPLLKEAMLYGQYGSEANAQKKELNESSGKNFELVPYGDHDTVKSKINELKATMLDVMPQDATLNIADGVLGEERFSYTDEVEGVDVDADALATIICTNLSNANYASVEAPVILTNPKINVEELKANTQLIGTYTSIYKDISTEDRITNIRLMSGFVNGVIIQPGETWSINAEAGPRNAETAAVIGWGEAHGITNGRYEDQYGGGRLPGFGHALQRGDPGRARHCRAAYAQLAIHLCAGRPRRDDQLSVWRAGLPGQQGFKAHEPVRYAGISCGVYG